MISSLVEWESPAALAVALVECGVIVVYNPSSIYEGAFMTTCANNSELTHAEKTALAILRVGRSFAEAAESSNVSVNRVMEMWRDAQAKKPN